jgi:antitoxin component YwqK of YwqJK toxin-antitoxin module
MWMSMVARRLFSLTSLFATLLLPVWACAAGVGYYPGGEVQWEYLYQAGQVREAKWYDPRGRLTTRARYQDGHQTMSEGYRQDGSLEWQARELADGRQEITRFGAGRRPTIRYQTKAGQTDGPSSVFHPNGQPRQRVTFRAGVPHGPAQTFYESGQVESEYAYHDGELDGPCRFFAPDGQPLSEKRFGKETGRE